MCMQSNSLWLLRCSQCTRVALSGHNSPAICLLLGAHELSSLPATHSYCTTVYFELCIDQNMRSLLTDQD